MAPDWSTLPMDLLIFISMKLETLQDFIYFSAVCHFCRDISSKIKLQWRGLPEPWLLLAENNTENPNCLRKIFNPTNNKSYHFNLPETFGKKCWGTPNGWVAMFGRDFSVQLFNPITKAQIRFPSTETIARKLDYIIDLGEEEDILWFLGCFFFKVVVLKVSQGDHDEFVIIAFNFDSLMFARHEDQYWTILYTVEKDQYGEPSDREAKDGLHDILGIDNKVYGLYRDGAIRYWNVKDLQVGKAVEPIDLAPSNAKAREIILERTFSSGTIYLAHLDGDLIMILRKRNEVPRSQVPNSDGEIDKAVRYVTLGFKVYRLDLEKKNWEQIDNLGGMTLFFGGNFSMSLCVGVPNSLQRDCIHFTEDDGEFLCEITKFGQLDMGIYDMKSKEIRQFYEGGDMQSSFAPPIWFHPQL